MAVDEFGREIPGARGGGRRSPSPHRHHQHREGPGGGGGGGGSALPTHLNDSLPTSRYEERGVGGGDRDHYRDRDRDRGGDDRSSSRKRKIRSRSPPPMSSRRGGDRGSGGSDGGGGNDRSNNYKKSNNKPHPSTVYVEEPMLCQFLWKEANEEKTEEDYDEYRKSYCLNYVRTFFNEHMDDSWFRFMYSPLERYQVARQERNRAVQESKEFAQELESSVSKTISSSSTTTNANGSSSSSRDASFFVLKSRLGGGIRQTGKSDYHHHHSSPTKSSRQSLVNPIPATHVLALTNQVLPIREVPHFVTDEQLSVALMQQVSSKTSKAMNPNSMILYSGPPAADLTRTAYLQATDEVRKEIIQTLNHSEKGGGSAKGGGGSSGSAGASHVPRKEDTFVPKTLELTVECSDAYGRLEVDADGKGGEPEERGGVPSRKASVWVSTKPINPHVQVLSAALSSKKRIQEDQAAAFKLANAYDCKRDIPFESSLENLLPKAVPNIMATAAAAAAEAAAAKDDKGSSSEAAAVPDDSPSSQDLEDALDVTIAYLRRVHLFSYYKGCQAAPRVADVFNGNNAASTIYFRLANADELLEPTKDVPDMEMGDGQPKIDLLVQRLKDSIQSALEESEKWNSENDDESSLPTTCIFVNEEIDREAKDIEYQQSQVEGGWIEDHATVDGDGRARCAFHFCRKLFKDSSFLKKHLIKKHSEFLRAEMAKCHDSYMMKAWDSQEKRPVPPILVDCGHGFGVQPSPVLGAAEPLVADPEPELWRREEERRDFEEKGAEARRERHNNNVAASLDQPLSEGRGHIRDNNNNRGGERVNTFVDVDDMKEEKVEIAFDKIEIPVEPLKKKRKKKKLL
jgi:hypothetical protein